MIGIMVAPTPSTFMSKLVGGSLLEISPEMARHFLSWQFTDEDRGRVQDLLDKNSANELSTEERRELDLYVAADDLLSVLHAKSAVVLHRATQQKNK
jgi:hypothetical protein